MFSVNLIFNYEKLMRLLFFICFILSTCEIFKVVVCGLIVALNLCGYINLNILLGTFIQLLSD